MRPYLPLKKSDNTLHSNRKVLTDLGQNLEIVDVRLCHSPNLFLTPALLY